MTYSSIKFFWNCFFGHLSCVIATGIKHKETNNYLQLKSDIRTSARSCRHFQSSFMAPHEPSSLLSLLQNAFSKIMKQFKCLSWVRKRHKYLIFLVFFLRILIMWFFFCLVLAKKKIKMIPFRQLNFPQWGF